MGNPFRGTRRTELTLAVTLVGFASAAIAAAQWGTRIAEPGAEPLVVGETASRFSRGGDIQIGAMTAPLFTWEVAPTVVSPSSGDEVALPEAIFAGGSSGSGHDSASYAAAGAAGFAFGGEGNGKGRPRRSSSGGASFGAGGSGGGMGFGGGAWGGVSGSASRPAAAGASTTAGASGNVPAPKLGSSKAFGSAGGSAFASSGSGGGLFQVSDGFGSGRPALGFPPGQPDGVPGNGRGLGWTPGDPQPPGRGNGPGSAPTPEPVTLLLVGLGAAALYGARRHLV